MHVEPAAVGVRRAELRHREHAEERERAAEGPHGERGGGAAHAAGDVGGGLKDPAAHHGAHGDERGVEGVEHAAGLRGRGRHGARTVLRAARVWAQKDAGGTRGRSFIRADEAVHQG